MRRALPDWMKIDGFRKAMASDAKRSFVAMVISALISTVVEVILRTMLNEDAALDVELSSMFLAFFFFGVTYVVLCYVAYDHLNAEELQRTLKATSTRHMHSVWRGLLTGGSGTVWAVTFSVIAVGTMLTIAVINNIPELKSEVTISNEVGLITIVGAWFINAVSFALHYAREDAESGTPEFSFPGTKLPRWSDYTYVAFQVATTFATSDVECLTNERRRLITRHTVLAFAFNTLIIAQLVSLLR